MKRPPSDSLLRQTSRQALVVFLENVGHIHGVPLPKWAMGVIDFVTEEYAKVMLRIMGAYRHYDRVVLLEDQDATGPQLVAALKTASRDHVVDIMLLVHGHEQCLVGYRGEELVGAETFEPLLREYQQDPTLLNLRMVYGVNCFGASLAPVWLKLGAKVTNGALGVNWLPEPSITIFLYQWLSGKSFSESVQISNRIARSVGNSLLKLTSGVAPKNREYPAIASSRQTIFGHNDVTIHDLL